MRKHQCEARFSNSLQPWHWASSCVARELGDDEDALTWYIDMRMKGVRLDPERTVRENLLSHNLMQVRPLACTPDEA
jgi:hypothetical protein